MKLEIESSWTTLADFAAFVACPKSGGPWPGIVVFQEIFGVNSHIQQVCARIAAHGYVAIAPDLFHRTVKQLDLGYGPKDVEQGRKHKDATSRDGVLADARGCIAALKARRDVRGADIGCVGFCFGGHAAFMAASLPEVKATGCFYGGGIQNSLDLASQIKGVMRLYHGEEDKGIPQDVVEDIAQKLMQAKVNFMVTTYTGAQHGFACDQRASFHADAAEQAWRDLYKLWDRELKHAG